MNWVGNISLAVLCVQSSELASFVRRSFVFLAFFKRTAWADFFPRLSYFVDGRLHFRGQQCSFLELYSFFPAFDCW